ncbi:F-box family protein with DUF295 [Prunus dulcis]|uniref:F-box family protein with DUF295 n=1 Tax=Prunus dulcis TaxID=3755 RepID=A0A5H2XJ17_PRUDU|nr:F-box family protein with DUF295 [Prunus dulcis]
MKSDRCLRTSSLIIVQSVHLTCLTSFGDARTVSARICGSADLVSETCQDCGSADFMSPRPARIADQADYGPLYPARATRVDLVSSRNLPAGQADHSPLISPAVEVRGIHHRANHSLCVKGRFCRIFGRSLRKFKEKLKSEGSFVSIRIPISNLNSRTFSNQIGHPWPSMCPTFAHDLLCPFESSISNSNSRTFSNQIGHPGLLCAQPLLTIFYVHSNPQSLIRTLILLAFALANPSSRYRQIFCVHSNPQSLFELSYFDQSNWTLVAFILPTLAHNLLCPFESSISNLNSYFDQSNWTLVAFYIANPSSQYRLIFVSIRILNL